MKKAVIAVLALAPVLAFAQGNPDLGNLDRLLAAIGDLVESALPIVVGLGVLAFFWGLVKFLFSAGEEDTQKKAKDLMIYSVVALFVMVSVWGLVKFIGNAFDIGQGGEVDIPTVQGL